MRFLRMTMHAAARPTPMVRRRPAFPHGDAVSPYRAEASTAGIAITTEGLTSEDLQSPASMRRGVASLGDGGALRVDMPAFGLRGPDAPRHATPPSAPDGDTRPSAPI